MIIAGTFCPQALYYLLRLPATVNVLILLATSHYFLLAARALNAHLDSVFVRTHKKQEFVTLPQHTPLAQKTPLSRPVLISTTTVLLERAQRTLILTTERPTTVAR